MWSDKLESGNDGQLAPLHDKELRGEELGTLRFSVVVPVYDQWHLVPSLLDCLARQTFPTDRFEIILIDNGSSVYRPPQHLPGTVRLLRCECPGSYAARNRGAAQAQGNWLVFTDADCRPTPDWLATIDKTIEHYGDVLIAGSIDVVGSTPTPGAWEIYDIVKGIPQERYVTRGYAATANLAVPKTVFDTLGGFDSRRFSGGDADFCRRAGAAGYSIVYVEGARVAHPARTTWREIATKARRVKGGQLTAGSQSRRFLWILRTMSPPALGAWHFLRARRHSVHHRLVATLVLGRVWLVELFEAIRLATGQPPERR